MVQNYHRDLGPARCTLKSDIIKSLWLSVMGMNFCWVLLLSLTYQSNSYNGWENASLLLKFHTCEWKLCGVFQGEEWFHIGEPSYPNFFVTTMKVFSRMMKKTAIEAKGFKCAFGNCWKKKVLLFLLFVSVFFPSFFCKISSFYLFWNNLVFSFL